MEEKFDALKWVREVRYRIYEETKHMTWEQKWERTQAASRRYREWASKHKLEMFHQGLDGMLPDGTPIPRDPNKPLDLTQWPFGSEERPGEFVADADLALVPEGAVGALLRQRRSRQARHAT